ncbi:unnamed protein product [Clonostachys byssicola]|uniref:Uncharacterized protein n=1 Tax=Clonostachys byssicola TaxID=160290 RepID=A0A9N9U4G0_9HYPO|nr:unnamed protein product [Clonostachys byssicola]
MLSQPKSSLALSYDLAVTNTTVDEEPPIEAVLQGYLELLKTLYTNGLRIFALFTLPQLRGYINTYNNGVGGTLKELKGCHHDVREQAFDTAPAF